MKKITFKQYVEATDIFGFEPDPQQEKAPEELLAQPIHQFDTELMMNLLRQKTIGLFEGNSFFTNEVKWGSQPGAIKLEVDTGYTFYIKKLAVDKVGNPRWATKKMFQLNRNGYGGLEDSVAQEIYEHLNRYYESPLESPAVEYKDLESLTFHVYRQMKKVAKPYFIPTGIKKMHENAYLISFEVDGHGVEAPNQQRVEQNQTMISYDDEQGTIRIFNYNIESPVGGRTWSLKENDIDLYFFPSQTREEIADCLAVHMKYY